jgi:hypothetical protein
MAGARDTTELVVATSGDVYVGAVGAPAPTDADTDPDSSSYYKFGFISEDGVGFSTAPEIEEFRVWQQRQPVRREAVGSTQSFTFGLTQWNAETVKFAFGGGVVSETSPGEFKYEFPSDTDALDERSLIVDAQDGDNKHRFYIIRGSVTEAVEAQFVRSALALLPVTFSVLAPPAGGSPMQYFAAAASFHS